jgi:hypothetical protein
VPSVAANVCSRSLTAVYSSKLHGHGGDPQNEAPPDDFAHSDNHNTNNFVYNPDYLPVTGRHGLEQFLEHHRARKAYDLDRNLPSDSFVRDSGGSGSEAACDQQSPANSTTNAVMGSPSNFDSRSIPTSATAQNSPISLLGSTIFSDSPLPTLLFLNNALHSYQPAFGSYPQGLGIQGLSYETSYHSPYDSSASFKSYMQDTTSYAMSEHEGNDQDLVYLANTQYAERAETESMHPATYPDLIYNSLSNVSFNSRYKTSILNQPDLGKSPCATTNVLVTPQLSNFDHGNYTPRAINTPTSSVNSDYSPSTTEASPSTRYYMSVPPQKFAAFGKPAQPLTALQMFDEATHQPTMDLVKVTLPFTENKEVNSMDYRDASWQGRSDEYKGYTPYVDFADFLPVSDMLRDMRSDPEEYMPDTATIFTSMHEVEEWRNNEWKKSTRTQEDQDEEELPQSQEEKAAIVKLLFKAMKTTVDGKSNPTVMVHFKAQSHSNAHVEAICWQLLEETIRRSRGGPLNYVYEPEKPTKSAENRDLSFAQRIDALIATLVTEKSVCVNLLRGPKVLDVVDYPSYIKKRTGGNRLLNKKKAEVARLGKIMMQEREREREGGSDRKANTASRPIAKRGKRSNEHLDAEADDINSIHASPPKRRSPEKNPFLTPARQFAAINEASYEANDYPAQVTTSSTAMASANSSPPTSATSTIRGLMSNYTLEGQSVQRGNRSVEFQQYPQYSFRSPLGHPIDTSALPPHRYTPGYEQQQFSYFSAADGACDTEDEAVF